MSVLRIPVLFSVLECLMDPVREVRVVPFQNTRSAGLGTKYFPFPKPFLLELKVQRENSPLALFGFHILGI